MMARSPPRSTALRMDFTTASTDPTWKLDRAVMRLTAGLNARSVLAMTFMAAPSAPHTRYCLAPRRAGFPQFGLQSRDEIGYSFMFHFQTGPIDDQTSRRLGNEFHFNQVMGLQRLPTGNQVHNAVGQSDKRSQFDG